MRHHIHALIHRLCANPTYCSNCGWWTKPGCGCP
jgi:hypothetical protein